MGYWGLTRYEDILKAITDVRVFSSKAMTDPDAVFPEIRRFLAAESMVAMDPPEHNRVRRVVSSAFSVRNVQNLEGRTREVCNELLDRVSDPCHFDLAAEFAMQLPVIVICELLGVPPEDRTAFKRWSDSIMLTLPVSSMPEGPEKEQAKQVVESGYREFETFLERMIEERKARPQEDLLSAIVSARDDERISTPEVISWRGSCLSPVARRPPT